MDDPGLESGPVVDPLFAVVNDEGASVGSSSRCDDEEATPSLPMLQSIRKDRQKVRKKR